MKNCYSINNDSELHGVFIKDLLTKIQGKGSYPINIALAGLSRSGKTTLANSLKEIFDQCNLYTTIIHLDNWVLPLSERSHNNTVIDRYQYEKLTRDIKALMNSGTVDIVPYCSKTREISSRRIKIKTDNSYVVLFEGVIAIDHPLLREISYPKLYLEIDEKIRKQRFYDFYECKGFDLDYINSLYDIRLNDEKKYIVNSRNFADVVLKNNNNN